MKYRYDQAYQVNVLEMQEQKRTDDLSSWTSLWDYEVLLDNTQ